MINRKFEIVSKYAPSGDQPKAIEDLVNNLNGKVQNLFPLTLQKKIV